MKIALISASWHKELVAVARDACVEKLSKDEQFSFQDFEAPGSLEIPLIAKRLGESGNYDGAIAFGLVVDGGIYRHEFVAQAVVDGIVRVQLDTNTPVISCVLTPQHFDESEDRQNFFREHLALKGREAADALLGVFRLFPSCV